MRIPVILALTIPLFLGVSCHESERSISTTETRELTLFDQKYPGNIKDRPPLEWRRIHGTQMRVVNYVAGPDDSVQIFMGNSTGGVLPNANRWLDQFGKEKEAGVEAFERIEVLERETVLVEIQGDFGGGMGQEAKKDHALMGFIRETGDELLTLKMTGPADAVAAERQRFLDYAKSLDIVAPQLLPESESKSESVSDPES